ncbi:probable Adenylosuccinate synthetase [Cephalotrichum gorgonifer]|uniref:Adenylosuccinate synthetase n=1 Tax=Cephalotrichum gorgonifer TaxID=2041049 RepID=A0AAE8N3Q2_9PEZI|nr:probable Adenylosuccinate synthetase [Cephalotrichum gorgonifer]
MGSIDVVLGAQWGKGKLVDILSSQAQICARGQGGHNAGHSIVANGVSYDFHLLPSGLMNANCLNLIGSGVVVHVPTFFSELETVEKKGLEKVHDRIFISDRCHIDFDLHCAVDQAEETELGANSIGTTKRGIGPTYASMATRSGITMSQMFRADVFESRLRKLADGYKKRFGDALVYDVEEEIERFRGYRERLAHYVVDAVTFINDAQNKNARVLIEGSQALMLDLNYGTYPFVTSTNTGLGGVVAGLGLNPAKLDNIIGIVKAYTTRVGAGPFASEDLGDVGTHLQEVGREWGVSTGRRRRCGWLDLVQVKYSQMLNYYNVLNLTKLDILDGMETIKIAVAYKDPETKAELPTFPADLDLLETIEVVYHEMPGWKASTSKVKKFEDLPKEAQDYVSFIEQYVGVKIRWIGTGPGREDMIDRGN